MDIVGVYALNTKYSCKQHQGGNTYLEVIHVELFVNGELKCFIVNNYKGTTGVDSQQGSFPTVSAVCIFRPLWLVDEAQCTDIVCQTKQ